MATPEATPLLGGTRPSALGPSQEFFVRPGRFSDIPTLALHATRAYWMSPINRFIAPRAEQYPDDLSRMFRQMLCRRMCKSNCLFLVACKAADPEVAVGYGQFARLGNDDVAREFVASKGLLQRTWLGVLDWYFWAHDKIELFLWRPRAFDYDAINELEEWGRHDEERYWTSHPERTNKWYAHSLVIHPDYQGKGIGKMLMVEPMKRAQRERVIMGLTASPHGEFLYRKLGFELLGDFYKRPHTEGAGDKGGGFMIWYPEGWEGSRHVH